MLRYCILLVKYPMFTSGSACCRYGKHLERKTCVGQQGAVQLGWVNLYHCCMGRDCVDDVNGMAWVAFYFWVGVKVFVSFFCLGGTCTLRGDTGTCAVGSWILVGMFTLGGATGCTFRSGWGWTICTLRSATGCNLKIFINVYINITVKKTRKYI